jgi:hypothetical protein
VALAVCLLFDPRSDAAVRRLWARLEESGVPTLLSHTHGRHVPHLSIAVLRSFDVERVRGVLGEMPDRGPLAVYFDALGTFRRGRSWLVPAVTDGLLERQRQVVDVVTATGADLHRHYEPGRWVPHCTIAPRVRLQALPLVAAAVYEVLPLEASAVRAALIDSSTGERWRLAGVP